MRAVKGDCAPSSSSSSCVGQGCQMRAPAAEPLGAQSKKDRAAGGGVVVGGRESYERLAPPVKIHQV